MPVLLERILVGSSNPQSAFLNLIPPKRKEEIKLKTVVNRIITLLLLTVLNGYKAQTREVGCRRLATLRR